MKLNHDTVALEMMKKSYNTVKENEKSKVISGFYKDELSINIKALYDKTAADEIEYDEWFKQNFETYVGDTE